MRNETLLLRHGRILTLSESQPQAQAMAIAEGRILAVGGDEEVSRLCGSGVRELDLEGRTVVPGLIDGHAHMEREGLKHIRLPLTGCRTLVEVLDRLAGAAACKPAGEWIVAMPVGTPPYYFDGPAVLEEGRLPNRWELDRAVPDHPVYIMAPFGTWSRVPTRAALNSRALALSGILEGAEARCGGVEFERDEAGRPNGIVIEHNERPTLEFDLLREVPQFSWYDRLEAVRRSMRYYNAAGTTSIYEGHGSYAASIALYQRLWERGDLTVRVSLTISPTWEEIDEAGRIMRDYLGFARGRGLGDEWLRVSGVFIGFGGNACIASLTREALPNTGWAGFVEWNNDAERYEALVTLAAEHDLRVHTVILENLGTVLPILEKLAERFPIRHRRWVMEHVGHLSAADHARVKALGLVCSTIPVYHLWKNGDEYFDAADEGNWVVPHRSLLRAGVPLAFGTDNIPISLFKSMAVARRRQERVTGRTIGPEQRLTGEEALQVCTLGAAHLSFEEGLKGSLEAGKLADLVVLPEDPTRCEAERLEDLPVLATMVGGRFVYENWEGA